MLDKIKGIEDRFAEIEAKLGDPAIISNNRPTCASRAS